MEGERRLGMGEGGSQCHGGLSIAGGESARTGSGPVEEEVRRNSIGNAVTEQGAAASHPANNSTTNIMASGNASLLDSSEGQEQEAGKDSERSVVSHDGNKGTQLAKKVRRSDATTDQLLALIKRQNYLCALSGRPLTLADCAVDHMAPRSGEDGENCIENLQFVTKAVNAAKGTLSMDEFIALCRDVTRNCSWR